MLGVHEAALQQTPSAYHEFLSIYKEHECVVYGFVEGKECLSFYQGFVDRHIKDEWRLELLPAGSRELALQIHQLFDWTRFSLERVCFFLDTDLSKLIPDTLPICGNIYYTDGYSIENDIVSAYTCRRILCEVYGLSSVPHSEIDAIVSLFLSQLDVFQKEMICVMSCILAWKRSGKKPNLKNIHMQRIFSFHRGKLSRCPELLPRRDLEGYLESCCGVSPSSTYKYSSLDAEFLRDENYKAFTRGKFVLWFLIEFCKSVLEGAEFLFNSISAPPKIHVTLSQANGVVYAAPRARAPRSLDEFVQKTYVKYITARAAKRGGPIESKDRTTLQGLIFRFFRAFSCFIAE